MLRDAVNVTQKLIRLPSESQDPVAGRNGTPESGVTEMLTRICEQNDFNWRTQEVFPGRQNLIVSFPLAKAEKVLLIAHMDTVSARGMRDPFSGKLQDNKIWGRGACDDKGSLGALFATLMNIKAESIPLKYDLTVVCSVDEECTMAGASTFIREHAMQYDLCVAMEPSLVKPISAHKGVYRCRILALGKNDNGGGSVGAASEASKLLDLIKDDLREVEKDICRIIDPRLGNATMTVTKFESEPKKKKSGPCRLLVDIRLLPSQSPAKIHADIVRVVGNKGKVVPLFTALGIDSDPGTKLIKKFQSAISKQNECDDLIAVPFPSDCSQFQGQKSCLVWGPGDPEQAHKKQEYIEISQLDKACHILKEFLTSSQ